MGTNYYAIPKVDDKLKADLKAALEKDDLGRLKRLIPEEIHIGKSSAGWMFLFNHNNREYYEETKESIAEYLSKCNIWDEYHREISFEEFWELVETKKKFKASREYGYINDGLNFSNSTEFS